MEKRKIPFMSAIFPTLAEQKTAAVKRVGHSCETLKVALARYARERSGRFILYGSVARGEHRFDSDLDLLVDFPEGEEIEAWRYAERVCRDLQLKLDIASFRTSSSRFLAHIHRDMKVIS